MLLAALSVLTSLLTELMASLQAGAAYNLGLALVLGLGTFMVAVATHYGLLKPTGVSTAAQDSFRTTDTVPGDVVTDGGPKAPSLNNAPHPSPGEAPFVV